MNRDSKMKRPLASMRAHSASVEGQRVPRRERMERGDKLRKRTMASSGSRGPGSVFVFQRKELTLRCTKGLSALHSLSFRPTLQNLGNFISFSVLAFAVLSGLLGILLEIEQSRSKDYIAFARQPVYVQIISIHCRLFSAQQQHFQSNKQVIELLINENGMKSFPFSARVCSPPPSRHQRRVVCT